MDVTVKQLLATAFVAIALSMSGCASLGGQSNDKKIAKLAGEDFVISVPAATANLNRITGEQRQDQSIYRLVDEKHHQMAYQSNGNRLTPAITIADPSSQILNSLNKYFGNRHQLRFIAKGTINNIDPDFIAKALKKGDYVIDVRLTELALLPNEANLFYPQAAFQFTIVDRAKGKNRLQDTCRFAEPENANTVRYYSASNAAQISAFLKRNAAHCLQYFATDKPIPTGTLTRNVTISPSERINTKAMTRVGVNGHWAYYPLYRNEPLSLYGFDASLSLVQRFSPTWGLEVQTRARSAQAEALPNFGLETVYGASLGIGASWHPNGEIDQGYGLFVKGQMGQYRENAILLSTNAVGLGLTAYRTLFASTQIQAEYTFWHHAGLTEESNLNGHELGLTLRYQFD
jgi:hypothetical protein